MAACAAAAAAASGARAGVGGGGVGGGAGFGGVPEAVALLQRLLTVHPRLARYRMRLACGLPRQLPAESVESVDPANAAIARADYAMVLRALGPCS